jgi:methylmalonyl-CoA/ethylmalonyl-CoA epimerase
MPAAAAAAADADLAAGLGARFDHFAVATRRIRDALPLWRDAMGGRFTIGADNAEIGWRTVRLEFSGAPCVELIEPLAGSTFLDSFLRRNPGGGLHHVTFYVADVKVAFARLSARGFEPFGADERWFQLFVHPRLAGGVLLQLMNPSVMAAQPSHPGNMTLDDVLAGAGFQGTGIPSP